MSVLLQSLLNLLFFRAGPQDMPASRPLLNWVIAACLLTDLIGSISILGARLAIVLSIGQIALYAAALYLLFKINGKTERWLQSTIALFGTLALINLASFPFIQNLNLFAEGKLVLTPGILIIGALQLWFFIVMARIIKAALEISMGRAVLLTFLIINIIPIILSAVVGLLGLSPETIELGQSGSD